MIIDEAEVLLLSGKEDFGLIKCTDNNFPSISINYLAICQYKNDENIYLFFCNEDFGVEQDDIFDSISEAKKGAEQIKNNIKWEEGYKKINFFEVDFGCGEVNQIERFGEDMLEVNYPNGYTIDVGYYDTIKAFCITVIKHNDWVNIIREDICDSDINLKKVLVDVVEFIAQLI